MLIRRFSAIAILIAGATVTFGMTPTPAGASTCGDLCVHVGKTKHYSGQPARRGGGNGGGGGGKAAPLPCPGAVNCNALGAGNAPAAVQRVPTIDVAYDARARLFLPAPHVHTSPAGKTYVQLRTGLWVDPDDFAHEEASATLFGTTVKAVADPEDITWNMGESSTTCMTAGSRTGTACGYTYQRSSAGQPNGKYAISVTVTWKIYWTCEGDCDAERGYFPDRTTSMRTDDTLAVGEVQTESRPG
ncbi:hypothetical protein [Actinoallomurus iriomotensis]|uniref:ATP/GTP-binding protein n=1 Tax=Actinoallomurus iriomotensis TaxID=478107 RepID=A0A9W6RXV9_9ACTN|nr:hypothetical protein [Actinoallomurus iriomotensis]GLY84746.1 hypothetical protein Airi02_026750 [Actinoallomurus iriomotensis]